MITRSPFLSFVSENVISRIAVWAAGLAVPQEVEVVASGCQRLQGCQLDELS